MSFYIRREIATMRWLASSLILLNVIIIFRFDPSWPELIIVAALSVSAGGLWAEGSLLAEGQGYHVGYSQAKAKQLSKKARRRRKAAKRMNQ